MKKFFYRILCGFFLGVSIFAPGFSGSIIAISMGIYDDLLRIISNPFKRLKQNILFCLPIGIGVIISAALFVLTFKYLFEKYEKATYLLFVGLIVGNLPIIFSKVRKYKFKTRYLTGGICAFAAAIALGTFFMWNTHASGLEGLTAGLPVLALSGFAGGITTLIPGMSVTMVLLIMGVYYQLIFMADTFLFLNFTYLVPFAVFCVCAIIGLIVASRVIKYIFEEFPGFANSMVLGFMAGSLISVLLQSLQIDDSDFNWLMGGAMLAIGLIISMLFVVLGKKMNRD